MKLTRIFLLLIISIIIMPIYASNNKQVTAPKKEFLSKDTATLTHYETTISKIKNRLDETQKPSINGLNLFRERLERIQTNIAKLETDFSDQHKKVNNIIKDFSEIKNESVKNTNNLENKYQAIYTQRLKEFKSQLTFIQNRLFQIRLIQYDINTLLDTIKKQQIALRNGSVFAANQPLYLLNTWSTGFQSIKTHSIRLFNQLTDVHDKIVIAYQSAKTWIYTVLFLIFIFIYFKFIWSYNVTKFSDQKIYQSLLHLIIRGIFPALIICALFQIILEIMMPGPPVIFIGVIRSLLNALSYLFFATACITIYFKYIRKTKKHTKYLKHSFLKIVFITAAILFINNMLFFSFDSYPYPFYPSSAVTVLNFVIGLFLLITTITLVRKNKKMLQEKPCD